jgi:ABC-type maltose transport system permease subunit
MPHELSGGQQQRVALARAMVINPQILLMDEPLSNLDAKLRVELRDEIRDLQRSLGITTIYVTHDQEEALVISDRICVMQGGRVHQVAAPQRIYAHPQTLFVGIVRRHDERVRRPRRRTGGDVTIGGARCTLPALTGRKRVTLALRPEDVSLLGRDTDDASALALDGTVAKVTYAGREAQYRWTGKAASSFWSTSPVPTPGASRRPARRCGSRCPLPVCMRSIRGRAAHRARGVIPRPRFDFWALVTALAFVVLGCCWSGRSRRFSRRAFSTTRHATPRSATTLACSASRSFRQSLVNSLIVGIGGMLGAMLLGVPFAALTTRYVIAGRHLLGTLAVLSLVSPPFIGAYAWIMMLGRNGFVRVALEELGLELPSIYGYFGIILVFSLKFYPFVYLLASSSLATINPSVEEAAEGLGAVRGDGSSA